MQATAKFRLLERYRIAIQCTARSRWTVLSCPPGPDFYMLSCAHKWVFAIGLLAVLVVFIAPSVDLPDTALRAQQNAQCIMLAITLLRAAVLFAAVRSAEHTSELQSHSFI